MPPSLFSREEEHRTLNPLLSAIVKSHKRSKTTIVAVQGGQGTGKTTLCKILAERLVTKGYTAAVFSLDDFYLSAAKRKKLAVQYPHNPFYQIPRGMPGTHDLSLLNAVLQKLKKGQTATLPTFDKSLHKGYGDRSAKKIKIRHRQDFVFLEGWCVGLPVTTPLKLFQICTKYGLPLVEIDPSLAHTKTMLSFLPSYQHLWRKADYVLQLRPDSPRLHYRWREQQERELEQKTGKRLSFSSLHHFVDIFLPLTYACYDLVKANAIVYINDSHELYKINFRKP